MTETALFIGRWQPFHAGHRALIDVPLAEGKRVVIAIRDTPVGPGNPYTVDERREQIRLATADSDRVEVIVIPDITEFCYGRDVGYRVREIELPPDVQAISGTKIRQERGL